MGVHMVDAGLFRVDGVPEEFIGGENWALYLLVLKMVSADTVNKIVNLATTEYVGTVLVMCVSLYFTRLKLFFVNEKKLGFRERIVFSWSFMICITSFKSKLRLGTNQNNMRINN